MARDEAYRKAEEKIKEARRTGTAEFDLSCEWNADNSEKLTELPESLGQLTQLQTLDVCRNQLTILPDSLGQMAQLKTLYVDENKLTMLPTTIVQRKHLTELAISGNRIRNLPENFGKLRSIETLFLGACLRIQTGLVFAIEMR